MFENFHISRVDDVSFDVMNASAATSRSELPSGECDEELYVGPPCSRSGRSALLTERAVHFVNLVLALIKNLILVHFQNISRSHTGTHVKVIWVIKVTGRDGHGSIFFNVTQPIPSNVRTKFNQPEHTDPTKLDQSNL